MPAAVHFSFLSFDDALISVSRPTNNAFAVGFLTILAILDNVALVVCNVYSKSVIHGKLLFKIVSVLVPLIHQGLSQSACICICLHTCPLAFSRGRRQWDSSNTAGSIDAVKADGLFLSHATSLYVPPARRRSPCLSMSRGRGGCNIG